MKIDVKKVGKLANLTLTPQEEEKFDKQLSGILDYVEKINSIDVKDVPETSQVTGLENVTRNDDFTGESLTQEEALSGTDSQHNGMFKVKQLIDSE